jgi:hypothetical protein
LLDRTLRLVSRERRATALLVAHLAEVDARKLHLGEGYSSLFSYCTQALHLSESAAMNRIEVARAARRFPTILSSLAQGSVHLTAVRLLAPLLTEENHAALLEEARHKTRAEVEEIVARLRPAPAVPSIVRRLPEKGDASGRLPESLPLLQPAIERTNEPGEIFEDPCAADSRPLLPARPPERASLAPLSPGRFRVQFTADAAMHARLRRAQTLLRHRVPSGDIGQILDLALETLLEQVEGRKTGRRRRDREGNRRVDHELDRRLDRSESRVRMDSSPTRRASEASKRSSRRIPAEVRRSVWERDEGRCAFRSREGRRCGEAAFLEFHHVEPFALGGAATAENIALRCRAHNVYEAGQAGLPWREGLRQRENVHYMFQER